MSYHSTIFTGNANPRGLGAGDNFPWRAYSTDTVELQKVTNEMLKGKGYCSIGEDGKLGPATCGAVREMLKQHDVPNPPPATCQSFTAPRKPPCGGGGAPAPALQFEPIVPPKGPSLASIVMGGTIVLAVGVLGYAIAKKKGMIK